MGRKMANVSFSPCVPCVCQRGGGNCISFSVRLLCNILRAKGGGLKKHIRRPPLLRTKMPHHSPYIRTQQHPTKYSTNLIGVCVKGGRKQRQQKEQKLHCPTEGGRTGSQDKGGGEQQQRIGAQSVRRRGGGSLGHRKSRRRESQKVSSLTMGSPPPFFLAVAGGGVWTRHRSSAEKGGFGVFEISFLSPLSYKEVARIVSRLCPLLGWFVCSRR